MFKEKAGVTAGIIWETLNGKKGMSLKDLKKESKLIYNDLYLGLGWLLREEKIEVTEVKDEPFIKLV
ncbi:MAG TPA: winged helix-turn-helix domain-containing protein [Bacteroidaceae bacterium]|nr:winged helix-turn-helix domain-containing protein [Bacteroidaceae bacterium]